MSEPIEIQGVVSVEGDKVLVNLDHDPKVQTSLAKILHDNFGVGSYPASLKITIEIPDWAV